MCSETACSSKDHCVDIDNIYNEIVHCLSETSKLFIPRIPQSALKHYWSIALDELKENSKLLLKLFDVHPVVPELEMSMKERNVRIIDLN